VSVCLAKHESFTHLEFGDLKLQLGEATKKRHTLGMYWRVR